MPGNKVDCEREVAIATLSDQAQQDICYPVRHCLTLRVSMSRMPLGCSQSEIKAVTVRT
jgi:hypothetical protein